MATYQRHIRIMVLPGYDFPCMGSLSSTRYVWQDMGKLVSF